MSIQDAYLTTFEILSDYYANEEGNVSLSSLLSDMDPHIFKDGGAADPATYNDWYNIVKKYAKQDMVDSIDIPRALRDFLLYYQQEYGYHFELLITYLTVHYNIVM